MCGEAVSIQASAVSTNSVRKLCYAVENPEARSVAQRSLILVDFGFQQAFSNSDCDTPALSLHAQPLQNFRGSRNNDRRRWTLSSSLCYTRLSHHPCSNDGGWIVNHFYTGNDSDSRETTPRQVLCTMCTVSHAMTTARREMSQVSRKMPRNHPQQLVADGIELI